MLDPLVGTFGPFLVPATVFVGGIVGYLLLYALHQFVGDEADR